MAIGWGEIGDLKAFDSKDAMKAKMKEVIDPSLSYKNAAHATWQFANEMKVGDIIFVKKGMYQLVGRGVVTSDYEYDDERTEDYAKDHRQKCDIVMARAVARLNILDELCLPLVKVGGYFLALKGLKATEELEEAGKGIVLLGGQVEKSIDFTLTNDNHRSNIIIKKVRDTPAKYPRMFGKIKKQPL